MRAVAPRASLTAYPAPPKLPTRVAPSSASTAAHAGQGGHHGRVVGVLSLGGDGRAFDVVHNGPNAAVAENAAAQLAKLGGAARLSSVAERGLSFTPNSGDGNPYAG